MARLFVSHASRDDHLARDLETWLRANGFSDVFLDHSGIEGGAKWRDALRAASTMCRAVICLVTENWLKSPECTAEFRASWYMGKRIIPLLILPNQAELPEASRAELERVLSEYQAVDVIDAVFERSLDLRRAPAAEALLHKGLLAAGALVSVGLDPLAFEIDKTLRPSPFPGLSSFADTEADSAIFFGRSREIAEVLETLRTMHAVGDKKPLVIFGASGAGKSSLLMAGVLPRLRREKLGWTTLRTFRCGADPLFNFADALSRTITDVGGTSSPGILHDELLQAFRAGQVRRAIATVEERLTQRSKHNDAHFVLSLDQAEELIRHESESARALASFLREINVNGDWKIILTIRSDSFHDLQRHTFFDGIEMRGYDLRALPTSRLSSVIQGPASRYGVEIEAALVDALVADTPSEDALPLLAFALQRLWLRYAADGGIAEDNYRALGGLSGLISAAAERALAGIDAQVRDGDGALEITRQVDSFAAATFVPALASVTDDGSISKRVATLAEFDDDQKRLLERFEGWRLITRKLDTQTVELTHEALLRVWPRIEQWLTPERENLVRCRAVQSAARAWVASRRQRAHLAHSGRRLREARKLLRDSRYRAQFTTEASDYLQACHRSDTVLWAAASGAVALAAMLAVAVSDDFAKMSSVSRTLVSTTFGTSLAEVERLEENAAHLARTVEAAWTESAANAEDGYWYDHWGMGQALAGPGDFSPASIDAAFELANTWDSRRCRCWRAPHLIYGSDAHAVANGWMLLAHTRHQRSFPIRNLERILDRQASDGSWPVYFDSTEEQATYATAFLLLTLNELEERERIPDRLLARSELAMRNAREWLRTGSYDAAHGWADYPQSEYRNYPRGLAALVIYSLLSSRGASGQDVALARQWRDRLGSPTDFDYLQYSAASVSDSSGEATRKDGTSYVTYGWELLALAELHRHQSGFEAARTYSAIRDYARAWPRNTSATALFVNSENLFAIERALHLLGGAEDQERSTD